jgi:hypothetical protein
MEKLLDDSDYKFARFTCDCMYHLLIVSCEKSKDGRFYEIALSMEAIDANEKTLWERIKIAWAYIIGRDRCIWEFSIRPEDMPDFVNFFASALHSPNTASTPCQWSSYTGVN